MFRRARPAHGGKLGRAPAMADLIEEIFNGLAAPFYFGQILVTNERRRRFCPVASR